MSDLSDTNSAQSVKVIGADSSGIEQTPVQATSAGGIHANLRNNAGTETGTSTTPLRIDPTGTTAQPIAGSSGQALDNLNSGTGLNALNVALTGTNYIISTLNSTTTQLAALATFTGTIETVFNQQAISFLLTSDQNGVLTVFEYIDEAGTRKIATLTYSITAGIPFNRAITANGNFFNLTFKNTGSATTTTLNINTAYGTLPAVTALGNGPVSLDEINGVPSSARPDGFLRVATDPTTLVYDTFETYDTVTTWTAGGTVSPTGGSGNLNFSPGTTANATSYTKTQPNFIQSVNAYLQYLGLITINAATITGNKRFWGLGAYTTPTLSAPVSDGAIFEIDNVTGNLFASIYSGSVRTQTTTLVRPTDGAAHRYSIFYRASRVYFELNSVVVTSFAFPNPAIGTHHLVMGSINGASVLGVAATLAVTATGVGDSARTSTRLSDGKYPWRQATVTPAGVAPLLADPALVVTISPNSPSLNINPLPASGSKFSFGDVTTAALTTVPVQRTVYTEQTVNSQMSMASSSALDTAAGTGARTVLITYLDQTMAGPLTTTITLNGTAYVNASVSNMCYIEKIQVVTAGSTGSNAGILTLKVSPAGAGATVGTIAATDNQTLWTHHYVPTAKTCYVSGFSINSSTTVTGGGALFILKASTPTISNSVEIQVSDFHRLYGQSSSTQTRSYISPIQIVGPARVRAYVTPESSSSTVQRASFDYIDN